MCHEKSVKKEGEIRAKEREIRAKEREIRASVPPRKNRDESSGRRQKSHPSMIFVAVLNHCF